jgi:hypothetical protein
MKDLKHVLIETSFTDKDRILADLSRHHCPASLAQSILPLDPSVQIWVSHLKPGQGNLIMAELQADNCLARLKPQALVAGQILSFLYEIDSF